MRRSAQGPPVSALQLRDQGQVLSHAGCTLASEPIEAILKSMYGRHHEGERKLGLPWKPGLRPRQPQRPQWAQSACRGPDGRFQRGSARVALDRMLGLVAPTILMSPIMNSKEVN